MLASNMPWIWTTKPWVLGPLLIFNFHLIFEQFPSLGTFRTSSPCLPLHASASCPSQLLTAHPSALIDFYTCGVNTLTANALWINSMALFGSYVMTAVGFWKPLLDISGQRGTEKRTKREVCTSQTLMSTKWAHIFPILSTGNYALPLL